MNASLMLRLLGSLKLTVVLLVCSMALVFFGTLDQVDLGIHEVQKRYFESFFVLFPNAPNKIGILPLPGGFLIGGLLLINLVSAFWIQKRQALKKPGIALIHLGIVLLVISGFTTAFFQRESRMSIVEGERTAYSVNDRENELVFTDTSSPDKNTEVRIPYAMLESGAVIKHPALPFSVTVRRIHGNAQLYPRPDDDFFKQYPMAYRSHATAGIGKEMEVAVLSLPPEYRQDAINSPALEIELSEGLGTWLVSPVFESSTVPDQCIEHSGKHWDIALRPKRTYNDYWVELLDVRHDVYPGSQIPRNYSSQVTIHPMDGTPAHQALIYMNHPLRLNGLTYYQSGVNPAINGTVLQVVRNPSYLLPYAALALVGAGMCWQFTSGLLNALKKIKQR